MKRLILLAILCGLLMVQPRRTLAQDTCLGPTYPDDWDIIVGTVDAQSVVSSSTIIDEVPYTAIAVRTVYSNPVAIGKVHLSSYYAPGLGDGYPVETKVFFYKGGFLLKKYVYRHGELVSLGWEDYIADPGNGLPFAVDEIRVEVTHADLGSRGADPLGLKIGCVGGSAIVSPTPSPSPQLSTPTLIPTATATRTRTPTMTVTSGGPTTTAVPTETLEPTQTPGASPTGTASGFSSGGDIFNTPVPPKQCGDVFNPCGQLPFAVPKFSTIVLGSPTVLASVTANATSGTLVSVVVPCAFRGSTGTATPTACPTSSQESALADFGTKVAVAGTSIAATAIINGPDGTPLDMANGAYQIGSSIGGFWGTVRGIQESYFLGRAGTLLFIILLIVLYVIVVKLLLFVIPILLAILRWVVNIVGAIK